MNEHFDKWWNDDDLTTQGNPFTDSTPAYWAWEGWCAGVKAERKDMMQLFTDPENQPTQHGTVTVEYMNRELNMMEEHCAELILTEREACAKVCAEDASGRDSGGYYAELIRYRGNT